MPDLTIIQFGPTRAIGLAMRAIPRVTDFSAIWTQHLIPRKPEIQMPPKGIAFGVCRCLPNSTDGSFEYLALLQTTPTAPIPPGMLALDIPHSHYAVFEVASYPQLASAWENAPQILAAQSTWQPFCGPQGCACPNYPSFELYPYDPEHKGNALLYIPVKRT